MKKPLWFGVGLLAGTSGVVALVREHRRREERRRTGDRLRATAGPLGGNIVILGAGFGGITAAHDLLDRIPPDAGWTVTLVDRQNYHLFTPLLYHAATGLIDPTSALFPVRSISRAPHFRFREDTVVRVDLDRRRVILSEGELPYDHLILALGSTTHYFGREASLAGAIPLKNFTDGVRLRGRILDALEAADRTDDPALRREWLTFAVVGGGPTGVELIGAIRGLLGTALPRQYPRLHPAEARCILFEAGDRILPALPADLAAAALERLLASGVQVRFRTRVTDVDEHQLLTNTGEQLPARTVIWAAGVTPSPVTRVLPTTQWKDGRLLVDNLLTLPGRPDVMAIGDAAACFCGDSDDEGSGKGDLPLPATASVACQQGHQAARILVQRLLGETPDPFRFVHRGELVSLGRHHAVAEVFGRHLTGLPAWLVWRAFYLSQLLSFRNQISVALDWSFAYAYQRDTVRLDFDPAHPVLKGESPDTS